jgi:hypothetical protein
MPRAERHRNSFVKQVRRGSANVLNSMQTGHWPEDE